ncbi:triose-phosphate isomerase [Oscillospiraceae bacterium LTW-04]|nr:triose-phosphate isomerase [Oscillospiraceae bacterium MB24-C1]
MKRTPIIAGNWKMNLLRTQAITLIEALKPLVANATCEVVTCVPFTDIDCVAAAVKGSPIHVGAQNCHWAESGAFTGEISANMLAELGVRYVVLGHSERRQYFGETDETVNARLKAVLDAGLRAIVCVGESLSQREADQTMVVIDRQIEGAFSAITEAQLQNIVIAYEPIWAIGTGKTATAEQAQAVCGAIRQKIEALYGQDAAKSLRIQYGGSMNAKNAAELLSQPDIDGGLIGGASLKAADFNEIVRAASNMM